MSAHGVTLGEPTVAPRTRQMLPRSAVGWWALVLSALGLSAWVVLPMVTVAFRETYPITDTALMPVTGTVLIDVAAALNVLCIWRFRERSVLNIIAGVLTVLAALFFTFMVVGEGLAGV